MRAEQMLRDPQEIAHENCVPVMSDALDRWTGASLM